MQVSRSVMIHRPPDEVFAFLAEIRNMPSWQPNVHEVVHTSDGDVGKGSTFHVTGPSYSARSRITRFEPPKSLALTTTFLFGKGEIAYELEPVDGETRLHGTVTVKLGMLAGAIAPRAELLRRGEDEVETSLSNVKRMLEDGAEETT